MKRLEDLKMSYAALLSRPSSVGIATTTADDGGHGTNGTMRCINYVAIETPTTSTQEIKSDPSSNPVLLLVHRTLPLQLRLVVHAICKAERPKLWLVDVRVAHLPPSLHRRCTRKGHAPRREPPGDSGRRLSRIDASLLAS